MKKLLVLGLCLLLLLPVALAVDLSSGLTSFWNFDDDNTTGTTLMDMENAHNCSLVNTPTTGVTGVENQAYVFSSGSNEYLNCGLLGINGATTLTIAGWFNESSDDLHAFVSSTSGSYPTGHNLRIYSNTANDDIIYQINTGGVDTLTADGSINQKTWTFVTMVYDGSNINSYINGVFNKSTAASGTINGGDGDKNFMVGYSVRDGFYFSGGVDNLAVWVNTALNSSQIADLYAQDGNPYGAGAPPPAGVPYVKIQLNDAYDNAAIEGLNVTLSDGTSNSTNAAGLVRFNHSGNVAYNVTDPQDRYFFYESVTNAAENATTYANLSGAFPTFSAYDIEGAAINVFNLSSAETSNQTITGSLKLLLPPNSTTAVKAAAQGYLNVSASIVTTGKDTRSLNVSGFYNAVLLVNATNAYTGVPLTNFSGWAYHNETGYNYSFSDDNGTALLNITQGNYTVFIDVFGYSLGPDNLAYPEVSTAQENVTFSLFSENSIRFLIYDEDTNLLINYSTTTVAITGNASYAEYTTDNGTLYVDGLSDGNYSIEFSNANYTSRTYTVTVADRSTQQLSVYLTPAGNVVVFTIRDNDNSQTIEGANVVMERLINATYTTVENKNSDITGRVQFSYSTGVLYRFTVTKTGYDTRVFELDPIIFDSYTIRLDRVLTVEEEIGFFGVTITYFTDHYPKWFLNNDNNTFTINFASVNGSLQTYGFRIAYPGGSNSSGGSNAIGETFLATFPIAGASSTDRVNLSYWYDSVYGENKTYSVSFLIEGAADNGTLYKAKANDFGLGVLEMLLIAVITTILVAGLLTLTVNELAGGAAGLLVMGFFVYIGFVPIWVVIPTFFVGLLIIFGRSTQ